jgi:hypothetical protein
MAEKMRSAGGEECGIPAQLQEQETGCTEPISETRDDMPEKIPAKNETDETMRRRPPRI